MRYVINNVVGEMSSLPGCSQVAVSHGVFIPEEQRGKGLGTKANAQRLEMAVALGYDLMICTVVATNHRQMRVLEKNGWSKLIDFHSSYTGNEVILYGIRISK